MPRDRLDAAAIVGIGETRFAKKLEESERSLALSAILATLDEEIHLPRWVLR